MSNLVPTEDIERIVGVDRHWSLHLARAVSAEQKVYVLHSQQCWEECEDAPEDLKECPYSLALDNGIDESEWMEHEDKPVIVSIEGSWGSSRLVPSSFPVARPRSTDG